MNDQSKQIREELFEAHYLMLKALKSNEDNPLYENEIVKAKEKLAQARKKYAKLKYEEKIEKEGRTK